MVPLVENTMKDIRSIGLRDDEKHGYNLKKFIKCICKIIHDLLRKSYAIGKCQQKHAILLSPIMWFSAFVCFSSRDALVPGEFLSQMFDKIVDFMPVVFDTP